MKTIQPKLNSYHLSDINLYKQQRERMVYLSNFFRNKPQPSIHIQNLTNNDIWVDKIK